MSLKHSQRAFSLIEVMVAVLVLCVGLLGAAAIQLNALKYTDSSSMRTQASFIAYDMLDRIRANNAVNYSLASAKAAATTTDLSNPRLFDWSDFKGNVANLGSSADGTISIANNVITITITWDDSRAGTTINAINANAATNSATLQTFTLVSRAFNNATVTQ